MPEEKKTRGPKKGTKYAYSRDVKSISISLPFIASQRLDKDRKSKPRGQFILEKLYPDLA